MINRKPMFTSKYYRCDDQNEEQLDILPIEMLYAIIITTKTVVSKLHNRTNELSTINGGYILVTYNKETGQHVIYNNVKDPISYAASISNEEYDGTYTNIPYHKLGKLYCNLIKNVRPNFKAKFPYI